MDVGSSQLLERDILASHCLNHFRDSCGMTPEDLTFLKKISPYAASDATPSWIRAPPESSSPMQGTLAARALSINLQIFMACASDTEPPNTVESWLNTYTGRPLMVPWPPTTPSPANFFFSIPKSAQRCSTS